MLSVKAVLLAWANLPLPKEYPVAQVNAETLESSPVITADEIQEVNREVEAVTAQGDVEGLLQ